MAQYHLSFRLFLGRWPSEYLARSWFLKFVSILILLLISLTRLILMLKVILVSILCQNYSISDDQYGFYIGIVISWCCYRMISISVLILISMTVTILYWFYQLIDAILQQWQSSKGSLEHRGGGRVLCSPGYSTPDDDDDDDDDDNGDDDKVMML